MRADGPRVDGHDHEPRASAPNPRSSLSLWDVHGGRPLEVKPEVLVAAGYTGRDQARVEEHINELAAAGIPRPEQVPAFYTVSPELLTRDATTVCATTNSSGEVEPVLIITGGSWWLGVGSDHTDRLLERKDVAESKRHGPKVLGTSVVPYASVAARWDRLRLRSSADGKPYQDGGLVDLLPPDELLTLAADSLGQRVPTLILFMGTVPLLDGRFCFAREFCGELLDPEGGLTLRVRYRIDPLTGGEDENR